MFKDVIKWFNSIVKRLALAIVIIIIYAIFISPIFSSRKTVKKVKNVMSGIAKGLEKYHADKLILGEYRIVSSFQMLVMLFNPRVLTEYLQKDTNREGMTSGIQDHCFLQTNLLKSFPFSGFIFLVF